MTFRMLVIAPLLVTVGLLAAPQEAPNAVKNSLPSGGDPAAGATIFTGKGGCANCHQVNGRGGLVGPDLSTAGTRSPDALRQKILDLHIRPARA